MRIKYKNKTHDIPDPVADGSEIIIKVLKIGTIPLSFCPRSQQDSFPSALRKIIFFFLHEGPKLTLNKIYAYKLFQKIAAERRIVFAYGQLKGCNQFAVALGPQACPYAEYLSFPKELTLVVNRDEQIDELYHKILAYLKENRDKAEALLNYSRYSGKRIQLSLQDIFNRSGEKTLEIAQEDMLLETVVFDNHSSEKKRAKTKKRNNKYDLFIAGAGSYPFSYILPFLRKVNLHTVIDINPITASIVGEKYGFLYTDTSCERALTRLNESEHPVLIVSTYHSTHLPIIEKALSVNPKTKIFVEKPPVTNYDQLKKLVSLRSNPDHFIEIGYNRRYSPFIKKAKEVLSQCREPYLITCIIKEKKLPISHWYYWPSQGTRITGNLCHWIDLGIFFIQKRPVSMVAISASDKSCADDVSCGIKFEDGSLLTLIASERGNPLRGVQEYIDIRCGDITITINDFLVMNVQINGRKKTYRRILRDKGHIRMYNDFLLKIDLNRRPGYPNEDLEISTALYLSLSSLLLSNKYFMDL